MKKKELEERYNKAVEALRKISESAVEYDGPEHNGYYALMDFATSALKELGELTE